jgi:hypothetical protein
MALWSELCNCPVTDPPTGALLERLRTAEISSKPTSALLRRIPVEDGELINGFGAIFLTRILVS